MHIHISYCLLASPAWSNSNSPLQNKHKPCWLGGGVHSPPPLRLREGWGKSSPFGGEGSALSNLIKNINLNRRHIQTSASRTENWIRPGSRDKSEHIDFLFQNFSIEICITRHFSFERGWNILYCKILAFLNIHICSIYCSYLFSILR